MSSSMLPAGSSACRLLHFQFINSKGGIRGKPLFGTTAGRRGGRFRGCLSETDTNILRKRHVVQ